ncbi:MAG TPA: response regulator [Longimicrobiales bacterium]
MSGGYVLVVEDNPDHRFLVGAILRRFLPPTDICLVDSAEAAIRYLCGMIPGDGPRIEPPGLVVLDLDLPGMSGFEFLEWIGSRSDIEVPVVVLTLSSHPANRQRARELGAVEFHEKPADFGSLADIVLPYVRPQIPARRQREEAG